MSAGGILSTLAARPGARLGTAGLVLGACVAVFGAGTSAVDASVDADLRTLHELDRLDRLVDEAGAQLMRARVAPRRELEAGTRGAFHRLTALSFQAEQTRGDLIAGLGGGAPRVEMADMLSADRRLWELLADESGLVREGAMAMASRLREDSQQQALDAVLTQRKTVREAVIARMREASGDAAGVSRAWTGAGFVAIALLLAGAFRGARARQPPRVDASATSDVRADATASVRPDTMDLRLARAAAGRLEAAIAATLADLEARMARLAWLELQSAGHIARLGTPGPRPQALDRTGARASLRAFDLGLREAISQVETLIQMSHALDELVIQRDGAERNAHEQEWVRLLALAAAGAASASRIAHQKLDRLEISAALLGRWIRMVDDAIALAEQSGIAPLPSEPGALKPADAAAWWSVLAQVRARLKRPAT